MMVVLTPEQAEFLRAADRSADGLLQPVPMNLASQLHLNVVAEFSGLGGMLITPSGRNAVHWHDAQHR